MGNNTNRCEKLETLFAHWKIQWRDDKSRYFKVSQCYARGMAEIIHFIGRQALRSKHETFLDNLRIDHE